MGMVNTNNSILIDAHKISENCYTVPVCGFGQNIPWGGGPLIGRG